MSKRLPTLRTGKCANCRGHGAQGDHCQIVAKHSPTTFGTTQQKTHYCEPIVLVFEKTGQRGLEHASTSRFCPLPHSARTGWQHRNHIKAQLCLRCYLRSLRPSCICIPGRVRAECCLTYVRPSCPADSGIFVVWTCVCPLDRFWTWLRKDIQVYDRCACRSRLFR